MNKFILDCDLYSEFFDLPDFCVFGNTGKIVFALFGYFDGAVHRCIDGNEYSFFSSFGNMLTALCLSDLCFDVSGSFVVVVYKSNFALFFSYRDFVNFNSCSEVFSNELSEYVSVSRLFDCYQILKSEYVDCRHACVVFSAALLCLLFQSEDFSVIDIFFIIKSLFSDKNYISTVFCFSKYVKIRGLECATKIYPCYDSRGVLSVLDAGYGLMVPFVKGTVFPDSENNYGYLSEGHVVTLIKCSDDNYYLVDVFGIRKISKQDIVNFLYVNIDLYKDSNIWPQGFLLVGVRKK